MVTIKNLKTMKKDTTNSFKTWVLGDILSQGNKKDIIDYLKNSNYGCQSGAVTSLIYYSDTKKIFKKYFEDILEIIEEMKNEGIVETVELNYNNLVWMAYEYIIADIIAELEA